MSKNTKLVLVIFAVAIPAIIIAVALTSGKTEAPSSLDNSERGTVANQQTDSQEAGSASKVNDSKNVNVEIKEHAYTPETITVKVGTTVTWTNQDGVRHDVVATNSNSDGPNSELLAKGDSYSFTFNKVGTYDYYCTPHPYMKGKVVVTE